MKYHQHLTEQPHSPRPPKIFARNQSKVILPQHSERCNAYGIATEPSPQRRVQKCADCDVFLRYLYAYTLTDASAINVTKVIIDITTKNAFLRTTLIRDQGTTTIAEIAQTLEITKKRTTVKHPQTYGKLERTHALLEANSKMSKWRISPSTA